MSNMSYCRFRNTLSDLKECAENMHDEVSEEEARARKNLIRECYEIVSEFLIGDTLESAKLDEEVIAQLPQEKDE